MRVDLVETDVRRVQTVLGAGLGMDRLEGRARLETGDRLGPGLQPERLAQRRRLLDHALGDVEDDARLREGGRGADDLGALLRLTTFAVQQDARRQGALGILPGHREQRGGEPARVEPVVITPAIYLNPLALAEPEELHDKEDVRRVHNDRRRIPLPLDVG